jgi:hypothetical protein
MRDFRASPYKPAQNIKVLPSRLSRSGMGFSPKARLVTIEVPTRIFANRQNRPLSAGMPLVEAIEEPILPENCQDQNQKRNFVSFLWHRIAASLFLPLVRGLLYRRGCEARLLAMTQLISARLMTRSLQQVQGGG